MNAEKLHDELEACDPEAEIFVEINGVVHTVSHLSDDSQGIYLVVDVFQEERDMR